MKATVKFVLIFVLLISGSVFLKSCAEDEESPGEYYLQFKANGTLVEYTNQLGLTAGFAQSGNQYVGTISGWNDASSNFSLLLYNTASIGESTFSGYTLTGNGTIGVLFAYKEKESGGVFSSGVTTDYDATATISQLTESGVKGTFKGVVKAAGYSDITISEGKFFVKKAF